MAKRALIATIAGITLLLGVVLRGEYLHYRQPFLTPTKHLGCVRDYQFATRTAFDTLVQEVEQHPEAERVVVEWKAGTFLDYLRSRGRRPYDDTLSRALIYQRQLGRFAMYEPAYGPTNFDWRQVTPEILVAVRDRHEDFTDLSSYGCLWGLP